MLPQTPTPEPYADDDPILGRLLSLRALPRDALPYTERVWYEAEIRRGVNYHVVENEHGWTLYLDNQLIEGWMKGITPQRKHEA